MYKVSVRVETSYFICIESRHMCVLLLFCVCVCVCVCVSVFVSVLCVKALKGD